MDELNRNELEVMRVVWEQDGLKPAEIQDRFGWSIDNGTLRSVLVGLVERGLLQRTKHGKAYHYSAAATRKSKLKTAVARMADVFAGGSKSELIAQLIRSERLTDADLIKLRELADQSLSSPSRKAKNSSNRSPKET
ncbi:MAG: BlaI/MecI/CopY family transcriptional regulator [Planctomycetota bacterium]